MNINPYTKESRASIGLQLQRGQQFKYSLAFNSEYVTSMLLEYAVNPIALIAISGEINNKTGEGKYGCGCTIQF